MNQIKYILSACLILLMISAAIFLYETFPRSGTDTRNGPIPIDYSPAAITVNSKGQRLFKQNCASCHAIDRDVAGPALLGVLNRGPWAENRKHVYAWVHNPQAFMKGNLYTQGLRAKYGVMMTPFPQLRNDEIDSILNYVNDPGPVPEVVVN